MIQICMYEPAVCTISIMDPKQPHLEVNQPHLKLKSISFKYKLLRQLKNNLVFNSNSQEELAGEDSVALANNDVNNALITR